METVKFVYYQEKDLWVGWLESIPTTGHRGQHLKS